MIVPQDNVVVLLYILVLRILCIVALIHGWLHVDCTLIGQIPWWPQEPACQVSVAA